jgi:DNA-binding transcriptional ArsR family regulator
MPIELNEQNAELIASRFKALSDPTRLRVLNQLRQRGEASVGEIADPTVLELCEVVSAGIEAQLEQIGAALGAGSAR